MAEKKPRVSKPTVSIKEVTDVTEEMNDATIKETVTEDVQQESEQQNEAITEETEEIEESVESEEDDNEVVTEDEIEESNAPEQRDQEAIAKEEEKEREEATKKTEAAQKNHLQNMDLYTREFSAASRAVKKMLYQDSEVIPLKDKVSYTSEGEKKRIDMLELIDSQKSKKILTGKVVAMVMQGKIPCAIVKFGEYYRVLIPYEFFVVEREHDKKLLASMKPSEQLDQKRFMINQRITSEVDFIVNRIDEENEVIIGNRVQAMQKKFRNWYLGTSPRTGEYLLSEGKVVEGRVVFSTSDYATIEVFGKEVRLTAEDLSWRYIPDISAEFEVGQTVPVCITALEREKIGKAVNVKTKFSVKLAKPDNRMVYFNKYPINTVVSGVVSGVNEYGIFTRIEDEDGGMDILCQFSDHDDEIPPVGSKVLIYILQKNEEKLRIFGRIVKRLK